ncbi:MAG TPA: ABC transporter substrate-binding protein [Actinomycetota bacterium]
MTRLRWLRVAALVGALALVASACGDDGGGEGDGDLPTVVFQGFPADPAALPLLVMQEEGLDRDNGFIGEYLAVDPDAATNTFLIGESDIAMEQDGVNMTIVQQEGHEAVLFAPGLNMVTGIVVAEDSPYQDPTDLVGERVGHFGIDSGTTSTIALMIREIYGLDILSEYDFRETGPEALPELLKSGEVEAILDFEPLALRAVLETPGRYLFEPTKAWAEHTGGWSPWLTNLAAREDWLAENEDIAIGIRDAWMEGIRILEDSDYELLREEPYNSFMELKSDEELDAFIEYCADLPCFGSSWTEEDITELNNYLGLFAEHDILIEETASEPVAVILEDYYG